MVVNKHEAVMKRVAILLLLLGALAGQAVFAEEGVVDKADKGIKKGADAAVRGIEKGADAAGKGIQKGVDATGKVFKKAGDWIEKKTGKEKDGEK
jgi:hypothetical protein